MKGILRRPEGPAVILANYVTTATKIRQKRLEPGQRPRGQEKLVDAASSARSATIRERKKLRSSCSKSREVLRPARRVVIGGILVRLSMLRCTIWRFHGPPSRYFVSGIPDIRFLHASWPSARCVWELEELFARADRDDDRISCGAAQLQDKRSRLELQANA